MKKIEPQGIAISILQVANEDYISLTDIARYEDTERTDYIIQNWMRNRSTIEFIGLWEKLHNPDFKPIEFDGFKNEAGSNAFSLTPGKWIDTTGAIGMISKRGRYNSGTFAHKDIAFEFATWISPEFKLYLIKEFQRLKEEENERLKLGWDAKRMLTKINYRIHTDAIQEHLIPPKISQQQASGIFANEADLLNKALFGMTAKEWRDSEAEAPQGDASTSLGDKGSKKEGNIRDYADVAQLVCLANLESMNAEYIRQGLSSAQRLLRLNEIAIIQMKSLLKNNSVKKLV